MKKTSFLKDLANMLDNPYETTGDSDHPTCPNCGKKMNFYGHTGSGKNEVDFPLGEGYWECKGCGFKCTEAEVYPYME